MNRVTRKLIAKELYLHRWLLAGGVAFAVLSVLIASLGKTAFNVGALGWLTTIIALGVMLAIYGVMYERKEQSLSFVLSLPLSIGDYVLAKTVGLTLCFMIPWLAGLCAALLLVFGHEAIPDGLAAYVILLAGFMLANFAVVLCGMLHVRSEALMTTIIIVTNMGVTLFMFTVSPLPGIQEHLWAAAPVWSSTFWTVLGCEFAIFLFALSLPFFFAARSRDFL